MRELLAPGNYYHIYNRGNNRELIFFDSKDYQAFMDKYVWYLSEYIETFAWCLIPNHFHFLIRIKEAHEICGDIDLSNEEIINTVSYRMRLFMMSYSKRINKRYDRYGSLFVKQFRRKRINSTQYLKQLVVYIHNNPAKHRLSREETAYKWTSINEFSSKQKGYCNTSDVVSWFGGIGNFKEMHNEFFVNPNEEFYNYFAAL